MPRLFSRFPLILSLILFGGGLLFAEAPASDKPDKKADGPDLSAFKTVETAITTRISRAAPTDAAEPGYLGVQVEAGPNGVVVADVPPDSPAAKANLQVGDVIASVGGDRVASPDELRARLQARSPGDKLTIAIVRKDKPMELTATMGAPSRPMKLTAGTDRAFLGVRLGEAKEGAAIQEVVDGSPAAEAGLKIGDVLAKFDGAVFTDANKLSDTLSSKKPGDTVVLTLHRDDKDVEVKVKLGAASRDGRPRNWDDRNSGVWKKAVYHLAVVPVEFSDVKHNEKIGVKDWETSLFSSATYTDKSVTGQKVFGSLHDFYEEQSYSALSVEGKVLDWVQVGKKRMDYSEGTGTANQNVLLSEALDVLYERDGKDALNDFDGIFFLYAGDRVQTVRGGLYWPHKANFSHKGKRWSYFICPELAGDRMANISTPCHEFGHMLGLPDLYARPENPGSEGLGKWCTMSEQLPNGRPLQFSAWCKEQLGWIQPAVIDPTVRQKLILSPVEDSGKECVKVLVRPDGSEYFLLENRRKKGFDTELPGEGLLVWRVVNNHPTLEESHGIAGPAGPGAFLDAVPFPSQANNAFTPFTTPSSRSELGGGLPVNITNIRRLPDGRITFYVGYEYE